MGAAVRYIMPQRGSQLLAVVGKDLRVVCAARDGNVGHAVVEQVFGSQLGIGVDLCGELRRYLPSEVVLGTPHHLVANQARAGQS